MQKLFILFLSLALASPISALANTRSDIDMDNEAPVLTDIEVLPELVAEEDITDEITIFESEEEYAEWLEQQESDDAETVYTDEEGNEYYVPEQEEANNGKPSTKLKKKRGPKALKRNCAAQSGVASWYGPGFNGRKTANGERFNQNALTAAHKTLRFGSIVRVTYKGKSVDVRINDAGPYSGGRVIDLSKAAAKAIGLIGPGSGRVSLKVIHCGK